MTDRPTRLDTLYGVAGLKPACAFRFVPPTWGEQLAEWLYMAAERLLDVFLLAAAILCFAYLLR